MTHANVDRVDLEKEIKALLSQRFGEVEIVSVDIAECRSAYDDEDDDGVEITVVFKGTTEQLVRGSPPGLFEMVRGQLSGWSKGAFPVFNFIASDVAA